MKCKKKKKNAWAFDTNNRRQGRTGMVKHEFDTGETRPIKQTPRGILLAKRNEFKELMECLKLLILKHTFFSYCAYYMCFNILFYIKTKLKVNWNVLCMHVPHNTELFKPNKFPS